jgi:hypothetical protein
MLTLYVVSDATGETAERMVRSALTQFENAQVQIIRRAQVRTSRKVKAVVQEARGQDTIVVHTLVSDKLRHLMLVESRLHGVVSMDMMGPLLERLAAHLHIAPQEKPGLFQQLNEAKSREIAAVAFAFHHDDGQNANELDRAELVVVGVSRTMKTPTMLYLAYRGWFAANVPLVLGTPPPQSLVAIPSERVYCLTMSAEKLQHLRRARANEEGIPLEPYASMMQIRAELAFADELCRKHNWQRIDVSNKSVEEAAREIISLFSEDG